MNSKYIGFARNQDEINSAFALAANTFRAHEPSTERFNVKRSVLSMTDRLSNEDVVVIVDSNQQLIGASFLIDRLFFHGSGLIKGTFISSICIAESERGNGFSVEMMNFSLDACEKRGVVFAAVIARKAADHFYNKFGFWGVSSYSKINLKLCSLPELGSNLKIRQATELDLSKLNVVYEATYKNLLGACKRSQRNWEYILWKSRLLHCELWVGELDQELLTYALISKNDIVELASSADFLYMQFLSSLKAHFSFEDVVVHVSQRHGLMPELGHLDFTVSNRQCFYGGHMIKLVSREWIKAQGVSYLNLGFEQTCNLIGADYATAPVNVKNQWMLTPFNIPLVDQI